VGVPASDGVLLAPPVASREIEQPPATRGQ